MVDEDVRVEEVRLELAKVQHLAKIGRWHWDLRTDRLTYGPAVYKMLGLDPATFAGTLDAVGAAIHPDDALPVSEAVAQARTTTGELSASFRAVHPDGSIHFIYSNSSAVFENGVMIGRAGIMQDVTERTLAEDALRRSEQRFRSMVERLTVGVVVQDPNAQILLANQAALDLLGLTHDQLIGKTSFDPAWQVIHEDGTGFPGPTHPVPVAIATRKPQRNVVMGVYRPLTRDRVWLLVNAEPELAADGTLQQVTCSFVDITERRRMQTRLAVADRMASVGTLAAGVAHEINNPLSYVLANLDYVADHLTETKSDPDLVEAARQAHEGAKRVRDIVRDLRIFSRGDDDRRRPVDLRPVIDSAVRMVWNQILHTAKLELELGPLPLVYGNESRLGQVLINLLVNATQSIDTSRGGENEIRLIARTDQAGRAVIEIRDTGCGIAPEDLARIFDPFFTTKPVGMGTGMGLSICQGIVAEMGGEITVESELGKGSTFRVTLAPAASMSMEPVAELPRLAVEPHHRSRVLIVDDEPAIGWALERALEGHHDVVYVGSAPAALAVLARGEIFDVLLCDLHMPHMTGMELHAKLVEAHPTLARRTLFLSGGAFTPAARELVERLANRVLAKPFDVAELAARISRLVEEER